LDTDKNVDRVIHAAAPVVRESEAQLLVVGDGRRKIHLIRLCKTLGIADRVHFTGFISKDQGLPDIYRMASVFITASEIETQGIVLLEAAASGLPLVAVNATCIPEVVQNGVNGYLTEPGNTPAMSEAIQRILMDPGTSKRMGEASRALAESHSSEETFDRHESMYHMLSSGMGEEKAAGHWVGIKERLGWVLNNRVR
jgi:glycosyltransferase involved in cell wall biosynthesis